ncbi:MAG: cysteine methyltransferase [Chloroflexi bacterium]|nr:MAG: cysteine methyltransferase [Deltaproteobacteria bacterium]RLC65800.1 MAG: cysteine methyltransferase [Chloroflexota bacterium]
MELCFGYYESPIGLVEISGTTDVIRSLNFVEERREGCCSNSLVERAVKEIKEYFRGNRQQFDVPLDLQGTPFQEAVWQELLKIPYGSTVSYGDIARAIGKPKAVRAVGGANHQNPIALIVPCHRVIGSDGSMTGYGSGIWRKEWLLKHEGKKLK